MRIFQSCVDNTHLCPHGGVTLPAADMNAGRRGCTIAFAIDDATASASRDGLAEL